MRFPLINFGFRLQSEDHSQLRIPQQLKYTTPKNFSQTAQDFAKTQIFSSTLSVTVFFPEDQRKEAIMRISLQI